MKIEQNDTAVFVQTVERFAKLWHGGVIPQAPAEREKFVTRIMEAFLPLRDRQLTNVFDAEGWFAYTAECETKLKDAADALARAQVGRYQN